VSRAIGDHGPQLGRLVALAAEVAWRGSRREVARIHLDHAALIATGKPVGLALRIGPLPGPPAGVETEEVGDFLASLAGEVLQESAGQGLVAAELQIDFDCAASKLDGYRVWAATIGARIAPVPLTITVLPSWLDRPGFAPLAAAAAGFVLQVHSLERPKGPGEPLVLCDEAAAIRWVEKAAQLGVPFRVALPTYGYRVAFGPEGKLLGISADGADPAWPAGTVLREVLADPVALAGLVRRWTGDRPTSLTGIIWYRLPVGSEALNWRWTTLAALLRGRDPRASLQVETRRPERGLVEIELVNDGERDLDLREAVSVRWKDARLLAGDVTAGVEWIEVAPGEVRLRPAVGRISAGERRLLGWLRFFEEDDVDVRMAASDS